MAHPDHLIVKTVGHENWKASSQPLVAPSYTLTTKWSSGKTLRVKYIPAIMESKATGKEHLAEAETTQTGEKNKNNL